MNPATRALLKQIEDPELERFVEDWDALEELVVDVYKAGAADPGQRAAYPKLRARLQGAYPDWAAVLDPHWRATRVRGQALESDPFQTLINLPDIAAVVDNWPAMQTLPAAREALNGMLVERIDSAQSQ